jgi:hypothetical protein
MRLWLKPAYQVSGALSREIKRSHTVNEPESEAPLEGPRHGILRWRRTSVRGIGKYL